MECEISLHKPKGEVNLATFKGLIVWQQWEARNEAHDTAARQTSIVLSSHSTGMQGTRTADTRPARSATMQ